MRILWLTPTTPDAHGTPAARAEHDRLSAVVGSHDIHVIAGDLPPGEIVLRIGDRTVTAEGSGAALAVQTEAGRARRAIRRLLAGPGRMAFRSGQRRSIGRVVARRFAKDPPDLLHITGPELAALSGVASRTALFLPVVLSRTYEPREGLGLRDRSWWKVGRLTAQRWERRWYTVAGNVGVLTENDRDAVASVTRSGANVEVVSSPGGIDAWWRSIAGTSRSSSPSHEVVPTARDDRQKRATIVVATKDRPQLLAGTLAAIREAADEGPGADVVVVEQGEPAAQEICDRMGLSARIVHDPGRGAARARNIGAHEAATPIVVFTDDDCLVPRSWVVDHLRAFEDPRVVATFGAVEGLSRFEEHGDPVRWSAAHHAGTAPWVIGHSANMAVDRELLLRLGGFDERLGPGAPGGYVCEDADLIVRLLTAGGVARSGVGEVVQHVEWRSRDQDFSNIRAYERGSGAWIGKLARDDLRAALPFLGARLELLRKRFVKDPGFGAAPVTILLASGGFVRGLVHGWRLGPWPTVVDQSSER